MNLIYHLWKICMFSYRIDVCNIYARNLYLFNTSYGSLIFNKIFRIRSNDASMTSSMQFRKQNAHCFFIFNRVRTFKVNGISNLRYFSIIDQRYIQIYQIIEIHPMSCIMRICLHSNVHFIFNYRFITDLHTVYSSSLALFHCKVTYVRTKNFG